MDAAAVATALQWSKRTGKFAGSEANFKELVNTLATATVDPRRVEPVKAEILGIGAFGIIERAILDGKPVAIKTLKAEVTDGRKALSQIMVSTDRAHAGVLQCGSWCLGVLVLMSVLRTCVPSMSLPSSSRST